MLNQPHMLGTQPVMGQQMMGQQRNRSSSSSSSSSEGRRQRQMGMGTQMGGLSNQNFVPTNQNYPPSSTLTNQSYTDPLMNQGISGQGVMPSSQYSQQPVTGKTTFVQKIKEKIHHHGNKWCLLLAYFLNVFTISSYFLIIINEDLICSVVYVNSLGIWY